MRVKVSQIRIFYLENPPSWCIGRLADEWSVAKCAAWKVAVMSIIDVSDSHAYKRKLKDVKQAATKKAFKQRRTVHGHTDV